MVTRDAFDLADYSEQGFAVLRGVLGEEDCEQARNESDRLMRLCDADRETYAPRLGARGRPRRPRVPPAHESGHPQDRADLRHQRLLRPRWPLREAITRPARAVFDDDGGVVRGQAEPQAARRFALPVAPGLAVLLARDTDELVTCFVYLDDADVTNGCLQVIPGSHLGRPIHPFKRQRPLRGRPLDRGPVARRPGAARGRRHDRVRPVPAALLRPQPGVRATAGDHLHLLPGSARSGEPGQVPEPDRLNSSDRYQTGLLQGPDTCLVCGGMTDTSSRRATERPLWERVSDRLHVDIAHGAPERGGRLPSEAVLSRRYDVSRVTLRMALAHLEQRGIVHPQAGRGWFVGRVQDRERPSDDRPVSEEPGVLQSFTEMARSRGLTAGAVVLHCVRRPAELDEARGPRHRAGSPGAVLATAAPARRDRRGLGPQPRAVRALCPTWRADDFRDASLYSALRRHGVSPNAPTTRFRPSRRTPRVPVCSGWNAGAPLLSARQVCLDDRGRRIERGHITYRGDRYRFRAVLQV